EALADLGTRLHLTAKAKQGLALCTHTLPAQEAACLLLIQTLQREHRDLLWGQPDSSSTESSSSSSEEEEDSGRGDPGANLDMPKPCRLPHLEAIEAPGSSAAFSSADIQAWVPDGAPYRPLPAAPNTAEGSLDRRKPEALVLSVLETLTRIRALKERLEGLWVALEEKSQDCRAHEAQELELMQEFFQAHSALLLAYQKARQKQESQVGQLETQVGLMTRRQAKQRQALLQTLQQLQRPPGAPPGLPQAPGPSESPLEPPRNLGVPSSFWSRK
ncbi:uncharacterized protein LOC113430101, partial [Notechis scutatus]|uniref:Uncharacterized protein LOC113430101 n=1 Tax=Notechis scutatus TaxID=8663 RepID=A0A6J1W7J8_9SAUR